MIELKIASKVLMVPPALFGPNNETSGSNSFQQVIALPSALEARSAAMEEYQELVSALEKHHIKVYQVPQPALSTSPDAVFPNNWVSFHHGGYCLYPMESPSRRTERNTQGISQIGSFTCLSDLSALENEAIFLEGTGSMILDREHKIAYASRSSRTNEELFGQWCDKMGYEGIIFSTNTTPPIYHTNVIMAILTDTVVIALSCISDGAEKDKLVQILTQHYSTIITINEHQVSQFCGNIIQLKNSSNDTFVVMSSSAHKGFDDLQIEMLSTKNQIISVPLPTIEKIGGGSARCMIAEIFE